MSQNSSNTAATLNGLFRQIYAKEVKQAIPDFSIIQKRVKFETASLLGDKYHMPIVLSDEHGFTYGGNSAANYALNAAVSMQMQDAQIPGSELTLQSGISYGAVSRAQNKGDQAVEQSVRLLMERMKASAAKRVEIEILYGASASGIGQNSATTGTAGTRTYTISTATWAAGIWAGMENASLDCYNAGTQLNTNAPVVITSVNVGAQQITVSGNSSDLTAIDGATTAATWFFYGAHGNEMNGVDSILTNSGTLFNINAATYNLWASQSYSAGSANLTMGKILSALALPVARGLLEDVVVLVGAQSWGNLNNDLSALRRFDESYSSKKLEMGTEGIKYHGQNGQIEIVSHPMVKNGEAFVFPIEQLRRVGSTDIAFRGEGPSGQEEYLFQNTSSNGWTCRAYTDQAVFLEAPAQSVKITNIVPT